MRNNRKSSKKIDKTRIKFDRFVSLFIINVLHFYFLNNDKLPQSDHDKSNHDKTRFSHHLICLNN